MSKAKASKNFQKILNKHLTNIFQYDIYINIKDKRSAILIVSSAT